MRRRDLPQEPADGYKPDGMGYRLTIVSEVINEQYMIICKLGWGDHSTVWLAWDLFENRESRFVALKFYKACELNYAEREITLYRSLNALKCPQIVEYIDDLIVVDTYKNNLTVGYRVLVTEVAGRSLYQHSFKHGKLKYTSLQMVAKNILLGLDALHGAGVLHHNVKPKSIYMCQSEFQTCSDAIYMLKLNAAKAVLPVYAKASATIEVLLNRKGSIHVEKIEEVIYALHAHLKTLRQNADMRAKIGGFGNASWLLNFSPQPGKNKYYRSPELILKSSLNFYTSDVYALACVLFNCATLTHLYTPDPKKSDNVTFDQEHIAQMVDRIGAFVFTNFVNFCDPKVIHEVFSEHYFKRLTKGSGEKVKTIRAQLELHSSMTMRQCHEIADLTTHMLCHDPMKRFSTKECLNHPWITGRLFDPSIIPPSVLGQKVVVPIVLESFAPVSEVNGFMCDSCTGLPNLNVPPVVLSPPVPTTTIDALLPGFAPLSSLRLPTIPALPTVNPMASLANGFAPFGNYNPAFFGLGNQIPMPLHNPTLDLNVVTTAQNFNGTENATSKSQW